MTERFLTIAVEKIGPVARLTLNRPERANALNAAMLGEIGTALDEIERDAGLRALIVRGAGAAFSSGFDLKEQMERRPVGVEAWRPILRKDFDTIMRFWHFPRADHCDGARPMPGGRLRAGACLRHHDCLGRCVLRRTGA